MHVTYFCELLINNNPRTTNKGEKKGAAKSLEFEKGLVCVCFFQLVEYFISICVGFAAALNDILQFSPTLSTNEA